VSSRSWYDTIGIGYNDLRRPDPRIAAPIAAALAGARSVVDVGAGTGAYEPSGCDLVAVEPSAHMLANYRGAGLRVRGVAEALPLARGCVDGAMTSLSMHHWRDWRAGLSEMMRIARDVVVIFTHDPDMDAFWIFDYFPAIHAFDLEVFEPVAAIEAFANDEGWRLAAIPVAVPHDCSDGFLGAYWRRPGAYLQSDVRRSISTFNRLDAADLERGLRALRTDIESGHWQQQHADLLARSTLDIGYRVLQLTPLRG